MTLSCRKDDVEMSKLKSRNDLLYNKISLQVAGWYMISDGGDLNTLNAF